MRQEMVRERSQTVVELGSILRSALAGLFSQEFSHSTRYLTAILYGCLFAPPLLKFWFINGLLDLSTAVGTGAVGTPSGL